jgi:hypothetical protein
MLRCGHHEALMIKYRHKGQAQKYCWGCLFDYLKFPQVNTYDNIHGYFGKPIPKEQVSVLPKVEAPQVDPELPKDYLMGAKKVEQL